MKIFLIVTAPISTSRTFVVYALIYGGFASKAKLEGCKHSLEKEKHFLNLRQVKSHQIPDDATHL